MVYRRTPLEDALALLLMMPRLLLLAMVLSALCLAACKRHSEPPPPLPVEQIGVEFQKGFAAAPEAVRKVANDIAAAVEAKKYPPAFEGLQMLLTLPELKEEQRLLASRAMLTVSGLLQEAQAQGDASAESTLKEYRSNR